MIYGQDLNRSKHCYAMIGGHTVLSASCSAAVVYRCVAMTVTEAAWSPTRHQTSDIVQHQHVPH